MKTYKDKYGSYRYVESGEKVRLKNNVNRLIARQHGMPLYADLDGQWRSVQNDRLIANPNWDYYIRKEKSPTYASWCPSHGMAKFWKDTRKCARCSVRRKTLK